MSNSAPATPAPGLLHRIAAVLRTIIGVPDYDRYVRHVQRCHAGEQPVPPAEFHRMQLERKYSRPGTRCC